MGEPVSPPAPGGRILIVMADGTSNAFGGQPTNIWRLYEALDCSPGSNQIVRYIPGVGTSSFRPFRLFDAVTGVGVPGNVRKLYRFLCWTYLPGDQIWMFGFSRGDFYRADPGRDDPAAGAYAARASWQGGQRGRHAPQHPRRLARLSGRDGAAVR